MDKEKITMKKNTNITYEDAFKYFIRKCKIKNLTENSIRSYEKKIVPFFDFIDKTELVENLNEDIVDDYIVYLKENTDANDITINSYLRTLRAFAYYCMDCEYVDHFKIKMIKAEKKIKETYTDEELHNLLQKPNIKKCTFSTYKVWVFENYLLGTGNRISTALDIQIGDIDFGNNQIVLKKTKNRKQQIIPLSAKLADILTEYLQYRDGNKEDYLFCNEFGEKASIRSYQQLVRRYNIKHNVNRTGVHALRHTFAKKCVMNGMDVFKLQKIMGHSDLSVTREYVNMFGQDLKMDYEKYCPLDNL